MASHELYERSPRSPIPSDWDDKYLNNAHFVQRTVKVRSEQTKVKASTTARHSTFAVLTNFAQRVFNFAQIFFFALTYMSSWETMAL